MFGFFSAHSTSSHLASWYENLSYSTTAELSMMSLGQGGPPLWFVYLTLSELFGLGHVKQRDAAAENYPAFNSGRFPRGNISQIGRRVTSFGG